jgi:hypothetical protein
MPFVKLDCGILNSTLWMDRECREVFITALLMAEPVEQQSETPQLAVRSLDHTGYSVPPGWYGFVAAAGVAIISHARVELEAGFQALERLGLPDAESRSREFEGRRLVRIDGGYLVLNFMRYRDKDHTGADRARRYRERVKQRASQRDTGTSPRDITHAECRVHTIKPPPTPSTGGGEDDKQRHGKRAENRERLATLLQGIAK